MSNEAYIKRTDRENGVAVIEFFHPAHNSLPSNLLAELKATIEKTGQDDSVKIILLQSGGDRTFCAGASFNELISIENFDQGKKFFMGFAGVINACRKSSKIIVGRVQGKAVGGGVGIASAVDYCLASEYASIKLSELAVGIGPFVIGPAVERKIGSSSFQKLALNATEWETAHWAKDKGLFHEVFNSTEQLDKYLDGFLDTLAQMNPQALGLLKRVFWENTDHWDELLESRAAMSGELVLSEYTKKTLAKYKTS